MPVLKHVIEIAASPERVWHVLTHPEEYELHSAGTQEAITSVLKEGVGVTLRVTRRIGPFALTLNGQVTEWIDAGRMTSKWTSGFPFFISTCVQMTLAPNAAGTRLEREYEWSMGLPVIGHLGEWWLSSSAGREMDNLMQRIKQTTEK